jgi:hypothetical protein
MELQMLGFTETTGQAFTDLPQRLSLTQLAKLHVKTRDLIFQASIDSSIIRVTIFHRKALLRMGVI